MIERRVTLTEAARHFADLVNRTYYRGESTVLLRSGEPVARIVPIGAASVIGKDWITAWQAAPHLDPEDADDFAATIESARESLAQPPSPWDSSSTAPS